MKAALLALALVAACQVSRKSPGYECTTVLDCSGGRTCDDGYCVGGADAAPGCPAQCTSCDPEAKTCTILCTRIGECDDLTCPAGYGCTIGCTATSACGDIDCRDAADCAITCGLGISACGNIRCGDGPCRVTCTGTKACGDIECKDACSCDVSCAGTDACGDESCPSGNAGSRCTLDGTPDGACSSAPGGCDRC